MRISTKGRYALRLMLDLALHDTGENIALKTIAKRQNISGKYLEQIIGMLTKAGFVKSVRGSSGGYRLAKAPEEYTVGDILRLTEGSLAPVACVEEGVETCPKAENCVTLTLWKQLNDAINGVVDHVTLADLVERSENMGDFYSI
ncbi:RrF2 family transcriptional regulator [Butyricicoccus porcorum]|uniref:Rrf2 family transcriptional regulator n=1 Tax=Butyricicoccus porcorum TaxID=1945634 RepID=A0A252F2V1_9FIRM|nr:Rrf2 family transcriptional regulator [Butyricicoccus porcorum]MCI6927358.1 Rrf2 family transcriptional regulator [Butyricicoccus porcorum]MDD6986984.1 Rrf2 family transcriptional regulator [Butyricicoccus porcorum]MDY4482376.1 Rrf2 family transcriptional regulator [Butyricicoccus porcorum]OUM20138.1 Rrf2 family transcriptional regulator [Butyricicoccus porcorum]